MQAEFRDANEALSSSIQDNKQLMNGLSQQMDQQTNVLTTDITQAIKDDGQLTRQRLNLMEANIRQDVASLDAQLQVSTTELKAAIKEVDTQVRLTRDQVKCRLAVASNFFACC